MNLGSFSQDADGTIRLGAFASTTTKSGNYISRGRTARFRAYADDKGAALYASGSVPDLRVSLDRMLVTYGQTGGHVRLASTMGHIKAVNAAWNTEQVGAVYGYLELVRSSGTITYGGYGKTAAVIGCVENSGAITVNTNHILAGVAAISKLTSDCTQTGKTAAFLSDIYDTTNWSDGTARSKWGYGLYVPAAATSYPIWIGESSNSAAVGHPLTSTSQRGITVYTDDGNAVYGADVDGIYSRSLILHAQNGAYAANAGRSHLRVVASLTPSGSKGFYGHLGYMEASGTYTVGDGSNLTILAALGATVETGGTPTIAANGVVCGIHVTGKTLPSSPVGEAVGIFFQAVTQGFEHAFGFGGVGTTAGNGLVAQTGGTNTFTHKIKVWINGVGTKYIGVGDIA